MYKRQPSAASTAAPATTELAAEQVLNLIYTDLALIDVNDVRNSNEFEVLTAVQEGLFRTFTDENGVDVVENAGCESYDVSDDGLTYTFHPVSYTHLDVYKRQALYSPLHKKKSGFLLF